MICESSSPNITLQHTVTPDASCTQGVRTSLPCATFTCNSTSDSLILQRGNFSDSVAVQLSRLSSRAEQCAPPILQHQDRSAPFDQALQITRRYAISLPWLSISVT